MPEPSRSSDLAGPAEQGVGRHHLSIAGALDPRIIRLMLTALLVLAAAFTFRNPGVESRAWTFPYFSGAANLHRLFDWRISPGEYERVARMDDRAYMGYRHQAAADAVPYTVNNYGYVLVVWVARHVFPWAGDGNAVVGLQVLAHLLTVLLVQARLRGRLRKDLFVAIYGVNPVVLHVVTFPFYYFWAVVPSVALLLLWRRERPVGWGIVAVALVLYLAVLVRPSTLFVCLLALALGFRAGNRLPAVVAAAVLCALVVATPNRATGGFWHTAYVGRGAYPNAEGTRLADEAAFEAYRRANGTTISTHPIQGTLQRAPERERYYGWLREQDLRSLRSHPWDYVRNGLLNTVQGFGPGYLVGGGVWINLLTTALGLAVLILGLWLRLYVPLLGLGAYLAAFTPYYPPIPSYLFGAYILSATIVATAAERVWRARREAAARAVVSPAR